MLTISTIHSGDGIAYMLLTQDDKSVLSEITRFCYKTPWVDNMVHPTFYTYVACFTEEDRRKMLREGSVVNW